MKSIAGIQQTLVCCLFIIVAALLVTGCGPDSPDGIIPVARITSVETVTRGQMVTLSATDSDDATGLGLTYAWTMIDIPLGSASLLTNPTGVITSFVADEGGFYTVELVTTSTLGVTSSPAVSRINVVGANGVNHPPVAQVSSVLGAVAATLNGSSSYDVDANPLTYSWAVIPSSKGTFLSPRSANTSFQTSVGELILVELTVSDGYDSDNRPSSVVSL